MVPVLICRPAPKSKGIQPTTFLEGIIFSLVLPSILSTISFLLDHRDLSFYFLAKC